MSLVIGTLIDSTGAPVVRRPVSAHLTDPEVWNGTSVQRNTTVVTDEAGGFELDLWPNTLGTYDSCYEFRVGGIVLDGYVPGPEVGPAPLARIAVPRDNCVVCGKNCPVDRPPVAFISDGWYADVDTTGLYAQIETAVLTSKPYPIEATEEMTVGATFVAGNLAFKLVNPVDSLDLAATLVSGELRVLLKTIASETESLDVGAALTAGELRVLLKSITAEVESLDIGAALVGGVLAGAGVSLTLPAEEMTVSATLTAGALL